MSILSDKQEEHFIFVCLGIFLTSLVWVLGECLHIDMLFWSLVYLVTSGICILFYEILMKRRKEMK